MQKITTQTENPSAHALKLRRRRTQTAEGWRRTVERLYTEKKEK